jgi:hypothetical protein
MTDAKPPITRKRMMLEIGIKNVAILLMFGGLYMPLSVGPLQHMPVEIQESMISLMGFLMAAAIIGAFELSYTRTNLNDPWQRYLAHITKWTLYSSIMLLMMIALLAIQVTNGGFLGVLIMASAPISLALVFYDFWDALRALDGQDVADH